MQLSVCVPLPEWDDRYRNGRLYAAQSTLNVICMHKDYF